MASGLIGVTEEMAKLGLNADNAKDGLAYFNAQLKQFANDAKTFASQMQTMANQFAQSVRNMVAAGFAGTQEAGRLGLAWQQLSRQIAALFIPVVDYLTLAMTKLATVFQGLSGHGQQMVLTFGAVAVALVKKVALFTSLSTVFGLLGSLLSPMALMWGALVQGLMDFLNGTQEGQMIMAAISEAMQVFGAVFKVVGEAFRVVADAVTVALQGLIRAFTWVVIKIASLVETILDWIPGLGDAAESVKKFKENAQANLDKMNATGWGANKKVTDAKRNDVTPSALRFEEINAAFERISVSAAKVGPGPEDTRHRDAMTKQDELIREVGKVKEAVDKKPPAVGR